MHHHLPSRRIAAVAFLLCACAGVRAAFPPGEESGRLVTGRVVDRMSGMPVESANVFLASTTRGTVTDADGRFVISGLSAGFFSLVATRIGYESTVVKLEVTDRDTIRRLISLLPRVLRGPEVEVVAPSPDAWRRDLDDFKREFLGSDPFGTGCVLVNPEVMEFRRDPATRILVASTDSVLRIRNLSLGYLLFVTLNSFRWDSATGAVDFTVQSRFEPLRGERPGDTLLWNQHRAEAYRGSVRHFLRALVAGQLRSEGFYVMNEKGESLGENARDVVLPIPGGLWQLATDGILRIDFAGETQAHRNFVRLARGLVYVAGNGTIGEQKDLLIDPISWWAHHRLGRMLPLEYVPR